LKAMSGIRGCHGGCPRIEPPSWLPKVFGMEPVRPLRDVFADLAGHTDHSEPAVDSDGDESSPVPRSLLADYADLPDDLLGTAIDSYASTAPAEVAEHLAGFIATPGADPSDGLELLASVPAGNWEGEVELADSNDLADSTGLASLDGDSGPVVADLDEDGVPDDHHDLGQDLGHELDVDHDPALSLDQLDQADSLDRPEPGADDEDFGDDHTADGPSDTLSDGALDTLSDGADDHFGSDPADTPVNDDHQDVHDAQDTADGHDYLEHQAIDHPAELDGLHDVDDFDDFDA
jgi:hypothetical protein